MATLQPFPKFTAFDANGDPLTGGLVYTYAAGTSTPLATYSDSSGDVSSENTNPVELDAAGQADIWYGENLYKLELKDSDGVLQWTVDNIGSGSAATMFNGGFGQANDIESASVVDLGTVVSHFANITGTVTITGFGTSAVITAPIYLIKFDSALTLTNSSNLFLPGSANITTAQNDRALAEYLGSGAWRIFSYMRANGNPVSLVGMTIAGTSAGGATLGFAEDTDNGVNKVTIAAPDLLASDVTVTLPSSSGPISIFRNMQVFTSGGTFTPDSGVTKIFTEVWGAGAGGGGTAASGAAGGGGAGGYSSGFVTVTPGVACTVTVGAGGAGGAAGNNNGVAGTASSFVGPSATLSGGGGALGGGSAGGSGSIGLPGTGGVATGGTLNINGQNGGVGQFQSSGGFVNLGYGADSPRGGPGGRITTTGGTGSAGQAGIVPGGSGSGGVASGATNAGGNGANGLVIVYYP